MSTVIWKGHAPAVAQVDTITPGGTIGTETFTCTINGKSVSYTAESGDAVADVVAGLVAAWNVSAIPEFAEVTAANATTRVTLTADTAGLPFTVTSSATGSATCVRAADTANAGPADGSTAANWSGGSAPGAGDDVVFEVSSQDLLHGLDFSSVSFASLTIRQSFTGKIGLPRTHGSGATAYTEYRAQYFQFGCSGTISVGDGDGSGSGRIKLDTNNVATTILVANTGSQAEVGVPAVLLINTNSSSTLAVMKGTAGHCLFAGESGSLDTLSVGYRTNRVGDATVVCGAGSAVACVQQSGGTLTVQSNVTTVNVNGGEFIVGGSATIGTLTVNAGKVTDRSTGTFTTVVLSGEYDHTHMRAKTITNLTVFDGAKYRDPFGAVTVTNGIDFQMCSPSSLAAFETAPHRTWTESAI